MSHFIALWKHPVCWEAFPFIRHLVKFLIIIMNLYHFIGIKDTKTKGKEAPKPLRFLQKIEKPIPRPPTPCVEVPDLVDEQKELAIIFLQQVIRGRAIQNMVSWYIRHCPILHLSLYVDCGQGSASAMAWWHKLLLIEKLNQLVLIQNYQYQFR